MTARICRRRAWLPFVLLLVSAVAAAQQKPLTLDDIYDPGKKVNFSGNPPPAGLAWIDGSHYRSAQNGAANGGVDWLKVDAATGAAQPLFDAGKMEASLARTPGVSADQAQRAAHSRTLIFDKKYSAALAAIADNLYVYRFGGDRAIQIASRTGDNANPSFSPDGRLAAFVRDNNLFDSDVASGRETALTTDGTAKLLNGVLDWVYEEEIYGRGQKQAYWWSPDSSRVAFLQIDDNPVHTYVTVDDIPYEPNVERWDYPRAGDPNPIVKLGVVAATGAPPAWVDTSTYPADDRLIVRVGWTRDSRRVVYEVQNRTQTWLDLNAADALSGSARTIFRAAVRCDSSR